MSQRFAAIVTAILVPAFATAAQAAIITKCGASKGYAYYFGGQGVPPGKAGWREDGISDGEFELVQSGKALDIVFRDSRGTQSKKAQGFQVFSVPQAKPGFMLVVAIHSRGVVEHYLFSARCTRGRFRRMGLLKGKRLANTKERNLQVDVLEPLDLENGTTCYVSSR